MAMPQLLSKLFYRYISKNGAIHGLGKKEGSMALTAQQVKEILDDKFLDPKMPQ
ncbi:15062_t:CDS:2, partial [Gigaspora margarita]